jgi:DNA-binding transcriptional LysR family regulator
MSDRRLFQPDRWLGIEFRHLAALEAVAEEGAFNRAGARLGYTQSAISQQIAALERAVGQKLVERAGGSVPVVLTPAGELLLRHAETIGARLAAAHADLEAMERGDLGTVRLGAFPTLGARLLADILHAFGRRRPDVSVDLTELNDDRELLARLERGELDAVFAQLPLPAGAYDFLPLFGDDYVLVVAAGADRPGTGAVTMQELVTLRLIGLKTCRSSEPFLAHLRSRGLEVGFAHEAESVRTIEALVVAGFGSAVMPRLATDLISAEVDVLELRCLGLPTRLVAIAWQSDRITAGAVPELVETARDVCERTQPALLSLIPTEAVA